MRLFDGQRAWVIQRISALVLLVLILFGVLALPFAPPPDFGAWRAFAGGVLGGPLIALLFGALCAHAWVGMRDIVLDYIQPRGLRLAVLSLIAVVLLGVLLRVLLSLATVALAA
jgi:succinate dehydrogenase / fumarate reductase membrane anchor subunit